MVKIFINAPFTYMFQGRRKSLASGQELVFDISKPSHREELRFLLSPTFGFRKFIRADDNIIRILNSNDYDEDELSIRHLSVTESPSSFTQPAQEPEENPFVPQYQQAEQFVVKEVDNTLVEEPVYVEELKAEEEVQVTTEAPVSIPETSDDYNLNEEVEKRYEELNATHWSKVKTMVEDKGMEYTNKQEVIEAVIISEFNISKETLTGILA
jgi:hypothetical protein